jgi:dipeptidyl aminopeptidase/acylaminoacyl peptidase
MRKIYLLSFSFLYGIVTMGQKKPLDHTIYDNWQSIGQKMISNNGRWVVYTINPQEGDNELVIQSVDARYKKVIARGDSARITEDSRFVIFNIKPLYKEIREAKIKKKRGDDLPKDSLGIVELGNENIWKTPGVRSYKTPEKSFGWVAYHLEKKPGTSGRGSGDKKYMDSLLRVIDSLRTAIEKMPRTRTGNRDDETFSVYDADNEDSARSSAEIATDLVLRNLQSGEEKVFRNVLEYIFSKNGHRLLVEQSADPFVAGSKALVLYYDLRKGKADTLSRGGNEFKNFALSDDDLQVAFLAERDARPKELQKFYKLWYYREGMDSAVLLADKNTTGMRIGMTISEYGALEFSKSGKRLFFGTAPISPVRDTTLIDIDLVKLDIWHYEDDYLQTTQLNRLRRDQQENYLAVYNLDQNRLQQLGSREIPQVFRTNQGDGNQFVGVTDFGKRIESQWEGSTRKDIYAIDVNSGTKKLVKENLQGVITASYLSPTGRYIMWYDANAKNYFVWDGKITRNLTENIKTPLYNEEHDSPSEPSPYGVMGWHELDSSVYIYDRYDAWRVYPAGNVNPVNISREFGRRDKLTFRYIETDREKKFFVYNDQLYFRSFNNVSKAKGIWNFSVEGFLYFKVIPEDKYSISSFILAKEQPIQAIYIKENYIESPDIYSGLIAEDPKIQYHNLAGLLNIILIAENKLSSINLRQADYFWGTAELFKWKAYNGKESEGIVYKPENFDPKKKYPLICYFYETLSQDLNNYMAPAPTPSRLNIPFFVSRGYIVFAPDIHYTTGHPGMDAFNHVVSGARALVKSGLVDSTRMGLQGQSWGGYQVAYIITATSLFKAAWAGAPVANMTSAYGGIRWESGLNRQFQYERTQSRIGATLWQKPQLYIDNSPLFHLPNVKTPLVIMANDADGAVPWYQGIELFTGMRRLGKKVWMLNYNGEAHNLVERKNKKDIQVRQQQFFDWLLKDEHPARWLSEGVPAVNKGKDWGLDLQF